MNKWVANGISRAIGQESLEAGTRGWRLKALDVFALFNLLLFAVLASSIYWQRFLQFRSRANLPEFIVYAVAIMAFIVVAWAALRPFCISVYVLVLFEAGLLLHFAGGLLHLGGMRLYDLQIGINFFDYPMRFDKIVHFVNAFIGCIITLEVFRLLKVRISRALVLFVLLIVLGGGAIIEIIEYVVTKTIPHNGVGDYDNNMTDLLANMAGGLVFAALWAVKPLRRFFPSPDQEP